MKLVVPIFTLPRTGSSLLAGIVHHLGVTMADKMIPANEHNQKGHFEDWEFFALNTLILQGWTNPNPDFETHREKFNEVVQRKCQQHERWGVKDVRFLVTWRMFRDALPEGVRVLGLSTTRDYEGMAASITTRHRAELGGWSEADTRDLLNRYSDFWFNYVREAPWPVLVIPFARLLEPDAVDMVAGYLGLQVTEEARALADRELVHQKV